MIPRVMSQNSLKYIENFFLFFILFQPILDLTSFFGSSVSLAIRVLAILIGFIYLFYYPDNKFKKIGLIYLILLGVFLLINTLNNFIVKDPFHLIQELTYGIKSFYVIQMILVYTGVFLSIKNRVNWEEIVQRNIFINTAFIGFIMLLAELFDSGNSSYATSAKEGHSGWFYSANDLSAILALSFGIMVIYLMNKKNLKVKLLLIPFILLAVWSMLTVGTKVGLGALVVVIGVGIIITFIDILLKNKKQWTNLAILTFIMIISIIYIPYSAIGNNMNINSPLSYLINDGADSQNPDSEDPDIVEIEDPDIYTPNLLSKEVLSGRDQFLDNTIEDYRDAPMSQKLLGMGPGGNYEKSLKLIEMDFLDWIFGYGIIGSILLFIPFVYMGFKILKLVFQHKLKQVEPKFLIIGLEITLGIGIAFFAGHIFLNPASGIYFSILFSYLYVLALDPARKRT